jgi:glycosyltransferase involved in cell wall biosynthesis
LVAGKQIDVLLDAVSLAKQRGVLVYAKIVGEGPEYKKLRYKAENSGISEQISFVGRLVKNSDVYEVIQSSKVFCLPSEVEGFGITLLEAMALGVPFIASDIPVIREVTNGGAGGILCSPGDSVEFCDALIRLLNRPEYRKRLANEGHQLSEQYNWDILSKRMLNLYKDVLNETNLKSKLAGLERSSG